MWEGRILGGRRSFVGIEVNNLVKCPKSTYLGSLSRSFLWPLGDVGSQRLRWLTVLASLSVGDGVVCRNIREKKFKTLCSTLFVVCILGDCEVASN